MGHWVWPEPTTQPPTTWAVARAARRSSLPPTCDPPRLATMSRSNITCTTQGCLDPVVISTTSSIVQRPWHETEAVPGFRIWHIIFLSLAGFLSVVIFVCCCVRIRIPRTKQEIEADYIRKRITRKFEKQLRMIHNADMDEMDLKRALDRVRAEFKSDTESLAQSDALSGATFSSGNFNGQNECNTYRKSSDIGVTFDELLEKQQQEKLTFPTFAYIIAKLRSARKPVHVLE